MKYFLWISIEQSKYQLCINGIIQVNRKYKKITQNKNKQRKEYFTISKILVFLLVGTSYYKYYKLLFINVGINIKYGVNYIFNCSQFINSHLRAL